MASQSKGIKDLMVAEKEASKIVKDARKGKQARLKQAVDEARKEIEAYKKERETNFTEQQRKNAGSRDDFASQIDRDRATKLESQADNYTTNKEEVVARLIDLVFDIKPDVHRNLKFTEDKVAV